MNSSRAKATAKEFVTPVINLNGNNVKTLLEQYNAAWEAYRVLEKAFLAIDFHGRDYQTLPNDQWDLACNQRREIEKCLVNMQDYLMIHLESLDDQRRARER